MRKDTRFNGLLFILAVAFWASVAGLLLSIVADIWNALGPNDEIYKRLDQTAVLFAVVSGALYGLLDDYTRYGSGND